MIGRAILYLGVACILLFSITEPAFAAWPVNKVNSNVCSAEGPRSGNASIAIATFGLQTMLLITSDSFKAAKGTHDVALSFDDAPVLNFKAVGISATYGVPLSPVLANPLRSATRMKVSANGQIYDFPLSGVATAIDDVRRCAGLPNYDETMSNSPTDIRGANGWKLVSRAPGLSDCSIRLNSPDVDTMILLNNSDKPILIAGRNDWAAPPGPIKVTLKIGTDAPTEMDGNVVTNIVLVALNDQQSANLKVATTVDWTLPWGKFEANISGVAVALESLETCHAQKHLNEAH